MTDARREITVEEIDWFEGWLEQLGDRNSPYTKAICALARRALSQAGEEPPTDFAKNIDHYLYGHPKQYPDAPLSQEGERPHNIDNTGDCIPQCWCKAAPSQGGELVRGLIAIANADYAESDPTTGRAYEIHGETIVTAAAFIQALVAERYNLKEEVERLTMQFNEWDDLDFQKANAKLVERVSELEAEVNRLGIHEMDCKTLRERVSVLEGALKHILSTNDGDTLSYESILVTARAALRTSENAK
jgi:hypothetical protein